MCDKELNLILRQTPLGRHGCNPLSKQPWISLYRFITSDKEYNPNSNKPLLVHMAAPPSISSAGPFLVDHHTSKIARMLSMLNLSPASHFLPTISVIDTL